MVGKIQRVSLREVWKHEDDFTVWLQDNIDVLNDALDLELKSPEREQAAGDFSVDIVAVDDKGNPVVIENQLEKSDHDHLGKLLTYLVAMNAKAAIWIVSDPRPEHVNTIAWLNESSSGDFYLVKVETIRINESLPAPSLTLIVGPSEEAREIGRKKQELVGREELLFRFWKGLLEKAKKKTKLHSNISPIKDQWISFGAGRNELGYIYAIRQHDVQIELNIYGGKESEKTNIAIFHALEENKKNIETAFGEALEWQPKEGKKKCRIRKVITIGGYCDEDRWPEIQDAMVDAMIRLEKAFRPYIANLNI
jgi:hypothetical protein